MANVPGVRDVMSLAGVSKVVSAGWSEGSLKWRNLPRDERQLVQAQNYIETSTGLLNRDCSVMPVMLFLSDHRAETIEGVVAAVKAYRTANPTEGVTYRLATGNVGVMAAQNEEVMAKEFIILGWVFAAVTIMCLVNFRSVIGTVMVIIPLALVSILVYAVMAFVGIGLKVNTLPMVALGAGATPGLTWHLPSPMLTNHDPPPSPVRLSWMTAWTPLAFSAKKAVGICCINCSIVVGLSMFSLSRCGYF
jgi:predicted RND superfamily exporter protein